MRILNDLHQTEAMTMVYADKRKMYNKNLDTMKQI